MSAPGAREDALQRRSPLQAVLAASGVPGLRGERRPGVGGARCARHPRDGQEHFTREAGAVPVELADECAVLGVGERRRDRVQAALQEALRAGFVCYVGRELALRLWP